MFYLPLFTIFENYKQYTNRYIKNMKLLCKVTSRARPTELLKCIKSYVDLCDNKKNLIWLFSFDANDESYINKEFVGKIHDIINDAIIIFADSNSKIHAINRDVDKIYAWDILVNISDDQLAVTKGWDTEIINAMPSDLDASLWFNDGHQDRLNTMEIVGREYYERFNYIYHPLYKSFFCDNEAMEVAQKLGKLIKVNKCIIKHFHPMWEKDTHMKKDETYTKAETHWDFDKRLFSQRKSVNYGL